MRADFVLLCVVLAGIVVLIIEFHGANSLVVCALLSCFYTLNQDAVTQLPPSMFSSSSSLRGDCVVVKSAGSVKPASWASVTTSSLLVAVWSAFWSLGSDLAVLRKAWNCSSGMVPCNRFIVS